MMYGFFAERTDPPHRLYSSGFPSLPFCLRPPPFPTHSGRRSLGHAVLAALQVLFGGPTTDRASLPTFATAYRVAYSSCPETLSVLLGSHAVLPSRAIRKHLGAVGG